MIQGGREILQLLEVMRKHFPGCSQARLRAVAPLSGVRETRRIVGHFQLSVQDLVEGRDFPDRIHRLRVGSAGPDQAEVRAHEGIARKTDRHHAHALPHHAAMANQEPHMPRPGGECRATRARPVTGAGAVYGHGLGCGHSGLPGLTPALLSPTWTFTSFENGYASKEQSSTTTRPGKVTHDVRRLRSLTCRGRPHRAVHRQRSCRPAP